MVVCVNAADLTLEIESLFPFRALEMNLHIQGYTKTNKTFMSYSLRTWYNMKTS